MKIIYLDDLEEFSDSLAKKLKTMVTKQGIGLGNADNTADMEKPVSVAQQAALNTHNEDTDAHRDIRESVGALLARLNMLADSDDETLDQMSEVVTYIKSNKSLIEEVTTKKVSVEDIVDNLTSAAGNKPLSAKQGKNLKSSIDTLADKVGSIAGGNDINEITDAAIDGIIAGTYSE